MSAGTRIEGGSTVRRRVERDSPRIRWRQGSREHHNSEICPVACECIIQRPPVPRTCIVIVAEFPAPHC